MDDTLTFSLLIIIAFIGVFWGISLLNPTGIAGLLPSGSGGTLLASAASAFTGAPAENGTFLISYDTFANVHSATIQSNTPLHVFDVATQTTTQPRTLYLATDHGMVLSFDSGLTWHQFTSSNNEITSDASVLRIVQTGSTTYLISVFQNGEGVMYQTTDNFFTLTPLLNFKHEAAYDMVPTASYLYVGLSNGQVIQYSWKMHTSEVVYVFKSPVARMVSHNNEWYILLKSGVLITGESLAGPFSQVIVPGGGLFASSASVIHMAFDTNGVLYVQTSEGIWRSDDAGKTFVVLKHIPLLSSTINAFEVHGTTVYVFSDGRLFMSTDGGTSWKTQDTATSFTPTRFFFEGDGLVLLTY